MIVPKGLKLGSNRRLAGEDVPAGHVVLPAGTVLEPQHIALAAALGLTEIEVRRRLKVAIFSTGDEVVEPGSARGGAAIYDANRYLLKRIAGAARRRGDRSRYPPRRSGRAGARRQAAAGHDLVITSGGVSTGEADHVRSAVERIGNLVFWRVAIKPGRPVAMGVIRGSGSRGHSGGFVGLPGNPVAVFVTFVRVVKPLLRRLSGARPQSCCRCRCAPPLPTGKRKTAANMCASRCGARRRRTRSGQAPAGRRRHSDVADGDRRLAGISRGRDGDRAGRARRLSVLRGAHWLTARNLRAEPHAAWC